MTVGIPVSHGLLCFQKCAERREEVGHVHVGSDISNAMKGSQPEHSPLYPPHYLREVSKVQLRYSTSTLAVFIVFIARDQPTVLRKQESGNVTLHIYSSYILKDSFDVMYTYSIYYIEKYHLVANPNVKKSESHKSLNKLQMS